LSRGLGDVFKSQTLSRSDWAGAPAIPRTGRYLGNFPTQIPVEALHGTDVVVHCAADIQAEEKVAHAVNVEGTIRLAELSRQEGVETFIFISSQSARPDSLSTYGRTKYAAEQALLSIDGIHIVIVRPGLVVGPGSTGLYHRLSRMVESMPVLPLLGGGRSIVQPIHVDDLCAAILKCDQSSSELHKSVLNLGHPRGVPLAEFLQAIAVARLGRRKMTLSIPLWPAEIVVGWAEALGIPLPISSGNLKGLRIVERMETEADMARLDVSVRPLDAMLRNS
jgi:nucleoside-diphosphate-sugar epimerase